MNIKWSLKIKNKMVFVMMKTFNLIFEGLKLKFVIFIGMKNLFNPNYYYHEKIYLHF